VVDGGDQEKKKEHEEGKEMEKGRDRDESPLVTSRARTAHTNTREGKSSSCSSLPSSVSEQCTHTHLKYYSVCKSFHYHRNKYIADDFNHHPSLLSLSYFLSSSHSDSQRLVEHSDVLRVRLASTPCS
jgi:hypothetical protein